MNRENQEVGGRRHRQREGPLKRSDPCFPALQACKQDEAVDVNTMIPRVDNNTVKILKECRRRGEKPQNPYLASVFDHIREESDGADY